MPMDVPCKKDSIWSENSAPKLAPNKNLPAQIMRLLRILTHRATGSGSPMAEKSFFPSAELASSK